VNKWRKRPNRGPGRPVVTFAASDYRVSTGPLRLVDLHVRWDSPHRDGTEVWYQVEGVELGADGRELGRRTVLVRGSRLRILPDNTGHHR
jgi:hypothetical protein